MTQKENKAISTEVYDKAVRTEWIESNLRDMLSGDTEEVLTTHELLYCNLFVLTGSNEVALKESKLDTCLEKSSPIRRQYLGMHLRQKPNLQAYIKVLQEDRLEEIQVDKRRVQQELVGQVEQLREIVATQSGSSRDRGHLLKAIELLGKTVGAYEDRVKVEEVSAASALDQLIEMAKDAEVKEIPNE